MIVEDVLIEDGRIIIWEITESIDELFELIPKSEQFFEEWEKIVSDKRRFEFLGVRVALKNLLGRDVFIKYDYDGKPYLLNENTKVSISHSGKWIAVIAHSNRKVGIDIEKINEKIQRLSSRFLGDEENKYLSGGDNRKLQIAWCAKEALYKIIGKEAVDFRNQLKVLPFNIDDLPLIEAIHLPSLVKYKLKYVQNNEYTLTYCVE